MSTSAPAATPSLSSAVNSYDEVPYESHPYPQTHPSRLFTVATLFGLNPPPVETARILELGCASGGNLIPIAEAYPKARLVGLDQSARQIADGQRTIERVQLPNLELRHASILDIDSSFGSFDYVICHGVFSWVPTAVREKILDVCAKHLTPSGVAYVSYNTYPGWHMRGMIRDMMRFHAMRFTTPKHRTQQARALLDFMASTVRQDGGPYALLLRQELEALQHQADHYLYHEHLEEVNEPLYFHQFVEMAGQRGLRYLGESRIGTMMTSSLGSDVEKALKLLAHDQIQSEQYMDFLRNRMFRETLLVRPENTPSWAIHPERVTRLHIASGSRPTSEKPVDLNTTDPAQYRTLHGLTLSTNRPLLKAAMDVLASAWPGTLAFHELRRLCREKLGGRTDDPKLAKDDSKELASGLLNCYMGSDLVEFHGAPIASCSAGVRPVALRSARERALSGRPLANRRHEVSRLPDLERRMLPLLDGTRDRPVLLEELNRIAAAGHIQVSRDQKPVTDPIQLREALKAILDQTLANLARNAMLTA